MKSVTVILTDFKIIDGRLVFTGKRPIDGSFKSIKKEKLIELFIDYRNHIMELVNFFNSNIAR